MKNGYRASRHTPIPLLALLALTGGITLASPNETGEDEATMESQDVETRTLFDFGADAQPWPNIDDVVMGGVSRSEMVVEDGAAVFRGNLSLENNGGFASIRSRPADHDLREFDGLRLRVRGDGRSYGFRLRTTASFDGVSYTAPLETREGEWTEVRIPFADFEPVFRGRRVVDHPPLDPASIKTFGLIIADGQPGAFRIELGEIEAYRE